MLLRRHILGPGFACVGVLVTTCTCAPSPPELDAGRDAGRGWLDSGARDAARLDAPRDVGRDAPEDAPGDGGPNDPEWVMLADQPEGVELFVARHPERVVSVSSEDCGEGCVRVRCSVQCAWLGGYVDGGRRVAWVQMPVELQLAALLDVDTGVALAAWKLWDVEEPTGRLGSPAYGGGRAGISGWGFYEGERRQISAWTAPVDRVSTDLAPIYRQDVTSSLTIDGNHVSATHRAWTYTSGSMLLTNDAGDRAGFPPRGERGSIAHADLIEGRVFYELWADHIRVWTGTIEEPPTVLVDATPGEVRDFRTDGHTMIWYQGYDYDTTTLRFARLELWTSPFATRAEDVRPRRVLETVRGLVVPTLGGHWVAMQGEGTAMDVFDLNDGSRRSWTPPEDGNVAVPPLYATDDEILVTTTRGTFRIDPNTLPIVGP